MDPQEVEQLEKRAFMSGEVLGTLKGMAKDVADTRNEMRDLRDEIGEVRKENAKLQLDLSEQKGERTKQAQWTSWWISSTTNVGFIVVQLLLKRL